MNCVRSTRPNLTRIGILIKNSLTGISTQIVEINKTQFEFCLFQLWEKHNVFLRERCIRSFESGISMKNYHISFINFKLFLCHFNR